MTANKQARKVIEGLKRQIALHEQKIAAELANLIPDEGLIAHWQSEIRAWTLQIAQKERRLP
jgi:hypothetical protein